MNIKTIVSIAAVCMLAVSCGLSRRAVTLPSYGEFPKVDQKGKVAVVAHRGFWKCEEAGNSQNSIAALREAQKNGFWGCEFDVQLTSDDVLIVNHDNSIDGKLIWDNPFSAFADFRLPNGEGVSTLDEYLTQGEKSKTTVLVLEFKGQKNAERENIMVDKAIDLLKKHGLYSPDRVVFISFSLNVCRKLAKECPSFINQYLNGDKSPEALSRENINGMDYEKEVLKSNPTWPSKCAEFGMSSNAWTVNSEEDIRKMIEIGVNAVTTNEPLLVRKMLGKDEFKKK